ncbi:MAG: galactose oxidase-like domain-containing protein [Aphanizomenon sp.]
MIINPDIVKADTVISANIENAKGQWQTVPLPEKDWMQGVHTSLLPNGKVLIVNGSSNRNTLVQDEKGNKFIDGVNGRDSAVVNNSALFDPKTNTFERISSPQALQNGQSNDPFCSANVHLPDGNVLFVSGSHRYYPGEKFQGSKQTNLYNWKTQDPTQTWSTVGQLKEGRWYPTPITLASGELVIFSGLKYDKPNQITPSIEIFDPKTNKFQYIDLTYVENSPFNTKIEYTDNYTYNNQPVSRKIDAYDSIDLYPRIFPTSDGKLLITGDGAGKFPLEIHESNKTYLMSLKKDGEGKFTVTFEIGPDRQEISKVYGTGILDPNKEGDVLLMGGLIGTNDIGFGRPYLGKYNDDLKAKGVRISKSLERWSAPKNPGEKGEWTIYSDFLGKPRSMNQAVILPTKQILTINGGEYGQYKPIFEPLLMTADKSSTSGYKTEEMNPGKFPRLYHNNAVLLPDARVLVIGGNPSRAARSKDGKVHVDVLPDLENYYTIPQLKDKDGNVQTFDLDKYQKDPKTYFVDGDPEPFVPAENWQAEIFTPPYLLTGRSRPKIVSAPEILKYGQTSEIQLKQNSSKVGSVVLIKLSSGTHSFDFGQRLANLTTGQLTGSSPQYTLDFTAPTNKNLYPPGYYMMFYVSKSGVPSEAKFVKLEA